MQRLLLSQQRRLLATSSRIFSSTKLGRITTTNTTGREYSTTISSILSDARSEYPLKDAIKFVQPSTSNDKSTIWTYEELYKHVNAFTSGLKSLKDIKSGDTIINCIATHEPEYTILLLSAAKLKVNIVSITNNNVEEIKHVLKNNNQVVALCLPPTNSENDGIIANVNETLQSLDDQVTLNDASTIHNGLVSITGKQFQSNHFPNLKFVIQTGPSNIRATISFKSLLIYDHSDIDHAISNESNFKWIGQNGRNLNQIIDQAKQFVQKNHLSSDHSQKGGSVIIKPDGSEQSAVAAIGALMKQSLLVSPHPDVLSQVSSDTNVVVS